MIQLELSPRLRLTRLLLRLTALSLPGAIRETVLAQWEMEAGYELGLLEAWGERPTVARGKPTTRT